MVSFKKAATLLLLAELFLSNVSVHAKEDEPLKHQVHASSNRNLQAGIVDGTAPEVGEYPWFALMEGEYVCGG